MNELPQPIADFVVLLAAMPGAVAVVLGGSSALRSDDAGSDWDFGLYYRGAIDLTALALEGRLDEAQAILGEELKEAPNHTDLLELERTFQEWRSGKIPDQNKP